MIPANDVAGNLPPGIHWASWSEISARFGSTVWRRSLLAGLRAALTDLKAAGCKTVYLNGSFVTGKDVPGDFDGCWEPGGVDPDLLDPTLLDFDNKRKKQKARYLGELFISSMQADGVGNTFLEFFQIDKYTGDPKGIIAIDLGPFS